MCNYKNIYICKEWRYATFADISFINNSVHSHSFVGMAGGHTGNGCQNKMSEQELKK